LKDTLPPTLVLPDGHHGEVDFAYHVRVCAAKVV